MLKDMWREVDVVGSDGLGEVLEEHLDRGLDIDAETMHQRFLADLPHLESAKSNHNDILKHISGYYEKDSTSANIEVPDFVNSCSDSIKGKKINIKKNLTINGILKVAISL